MNRPAPVAAEEEPTVRREGQHVGAVAEAVQRRQRSAVTAPDDDLGTAAREVVAVGRIGQGGGVVRVTRDASEEPAGEGPDPHTPIRGQRDEHGAVRRHRDVRQVATEPLERALEATRAVPDRETGWLEVVIRRDDRLSVGRQRDSLGRALPRGADGDRVDQLARARVHVHPVVVLSAAHEVRSVGREPEARRAVR